jgi:hypothetical protein
MAYTALVLNLMIASPGDVNPERQLVRSVIADWNSANSEARKIVIRTLGWDTDCYPEMGGPPQGIINRQILACADILVGIFGSIIGSPTEDYVSGTVEEIERHNGAKKLTMLYFKSQFNSAESNPDQLEKVREYKEKCRRRAYYAAYSNELEFQSKFNRHIQAVISNISIVDESIIVNEQIEQNDHVEVLRMTSDEQELILSMCEDCNGEARYRQRLGALSLVSHNKEFVTTQSRRECQSAVRMAG